MKNKMATFKLMEIGKLTNIDIMISLFIYALPMVILVQPNLLIKQLALVALILLNITLIHKRYIKKKVDVQNPMLYLAFLLSTFIYLFLLLISSTITDGMFREMGILIAIYAFLYASGIIIFFLFNSIFILLLKKVFPKHSQVTKKEEVPSLKKLSAFIDLHTQKVYFTLVLLDSFLYLVFVGFILMIFLKHIDVPDAFVMSTLSNWAKQQESIFVTFNAVALLSLLITVYSKTFSVRRRIQLVAYRRMKKRFHAS